VLHQQGKRYNVPFRANLQLLATLQAERALIVEREGTTSCFERFKMHLQNQTTMTRIASISQMIRMVSLWHSRATSIQRNLLNMTGKTKGDVEVCQCGL
jgi:hypothetical protein